MKRLSIISFVGIVCIFDTIFVLCKGTRLGFGTLLPVVFGILLLVYSYVRYRFKNREWFVLLKRTVIVLLLMGLIGLVSMEGMIISGMYSNNYDEDENISAKVIVVLGGGIKNGKLTLSLKERMDVCINLLSKNKDSIVVVTGGLDKNELITEAQAMENYLIKNGIGKDRILKEEKSTSTFENFLYTKKLLQSTGYYKDRITIVTSDYHMFRAKMLARRCGFKADGAIAKTPLYVLVNSHIREYAAIVKSFFFDRVKR